MSFLQKPKASWTEVHTQVVNDINHRIYFSDGGAVKITQDTDKGERQVFMGPGQAIRVMADLCPEAELLKSLVNALDAASEDIEKAKAAKYAQIKVQKVMEREMLKNIARRQEYKRQGFTDAQIDVLMGKIA